MPSNFTVIPDGIDGTRDERFVAQIFFLRVRWLLVNKRIGVIGVAREVLRRHITADIAVNALLVDVVTAGFVIGQLRGWVRLSGKFRHEA